MTTLPVIQRVAIIIDNRKLKTGKQLAAINKM